MINIDSTTVAVETSAELKSILIKWIENTGILFKVITPLYNGESYSTFINWILSNKLL